MFHKIMADGFFVFSFIAVLAAMYGWAMTEDLWLASTQWILVAIFLMLVAIYVRLSAADDEKLLRKRRNGK